MKKYFFIVSFLTGMLLMQSCSRKTTATKTAEAEMAAKEEMAAKKAVLYKPPVKTPVPKSIIVNDKAATKTVEGRYYYDLEGKRYWRNKKDGKYYLYYKGIFENKDFQ